MANRRADGPIPVSNSMFACLTLDDEMNVEKKSRRKRNNNTDDTGSNTKKNDKKKGKNTNENKQLQQMAFGKPGSAGKKKSGKNVNDSNGINQEQDWAIWKQHDKEVVEDQFKDDLEKALLESRLQQEQKITEDKEKQERIDSGVAVPATREERKKKKQKEKAKPMSLEEFKQLPISTPKANPSDSEEDESIPPHINYRVPSTEQDTTFFNKVHKDAEQILRQDKMQQEYRKTYAADNAVVAKLKNDIEVRDKQIEELKTQMNKMEEKMKQVKQRNKQLCVILAQGEMKDKAQVLLQVDELNGVKDELMEQVTTLTAELEKEKSKNRALKTESDKLKTGKHGK